MTTPHPPGARSRPPAASRRRPGRDCGSSAPSTRWLTRSRRAARPRASSAHTATHSTPAPPKELEAAVARIETEPGTEAVFAVGDPSHILAEASEQLDLLLVGSRGYGPDARRHRRGRRRASRARSCLPRIVLPHSAGHTEEDSLFRTDRVPARSRAVSLRSFPAVAVRHHLRSSPVPPRMAARRPAR